MRYVLAFCLGMWTIFVGPNPATAWNRCHDLWISVDQQKFEIIRVQMLKGKLLMQSSTVVTVKQKDTYGPKVLITIKIIQGLPGESVYIVQQNFCAMSAGDISVTYVSGPHLDKTNRRGSHGNFMGKGSRSGEVRFTGELVTRTKPWGGTN